MFSFTVLETALLCFYSSLFFQNSDYVEEKTENPVVPVLPSLDDETAEVTARNLNVRCRPSSQSTSICILKKGDVVKIKGLKDGENGKWFMIELPLHSNVWIAKENIVNNQLIKKTDAYTGPSITHQMYGYLPAGLSVKIIRERNAWIVIEPPKDLLTGYVSVDFLKLTQTQKDKWIRPIPESTTIIQSNLSTINSQNAKILSGNHPLPYLDEGKIVLLEGVILPLTGDATHVTHGLVVFQENSYQVVCYLHADPKQYQLDSFIRKGVQIRGVLQRVYGWQYPALEIDKLSVDWDENPIR